MNKIPRFEVWLINQKPERDGARRGREIFAHKNTRDTRKKSARRTKRTLSAFRPKATKKVGILGVFSFRERVLDVVRHISKGNTLSYKEVAKRAGNPGAARAVGAIMKTNFDPKIPCHRVIRSDGKPGGYNRGAANKARILEEERRV